MTSVFRPNQSDKNSYTVYGQSVVDRGLCVLNGISGVGLLTDGLVWSAYDVWLDPQRAAPISTLWSESNAPVVTAWTNSDSNINTTWTPSRSGLEYPS